MASSKKRDAIIRATIELAAEKGINGASTALIAERAQTAEVTIFRQFKTKEALLHTIFEEKLEQIRHILLRDHDKTLPIKDRLNDYCVKILQYFLVNPLELSFLEQYVHTPIGWARRPDMRYQPGEDFADYPMVELLSEGIRQKAIKDLPVPALMGMVIGPLAAFARESHLKGLQHGQQKCEEVIWACWEGLRV